MGSWDTLGSLTGVSAAAFQELPPLDRLTEAYQEQRCPESYRSEGTLAPGRRRYYIHRLDTAPYAPFFLKVRRTLPRRADLSLTPKRAGSSCTSRSPHKYTCW